MTYHLRGDLYDRQSPIEMAQVQPHEPDPAKPAVFEHAAAAEVDSTEAHITLHQVIKLHILISVNFSTGNLC